MTMRWSEKDEAIYQTAVKKYKFRREDFESYKAKKYYVEPLDEMKLQMEVDERNNKLRFLKNFKELPKASVRSYGMHERTETIEVLTFLGAATSWFFGRVYANERYGIYNTNNRIRKCRLQMFLCYLAWEMLYVPSMVQFMPQNMEKPMRFERQMQNMYDREMDLYQNAKKFINEDVNPTWDEYRAANNRAFIRSIK